MSCYTLLFKIKGVENLTSVISSSDDEMVTFDTALERIDYSPNTLLEDGQCYQIKQFNEKDYCPCFLKNTFSTASYSQWSSQQKDIEFILNTDGNTFFFQKFVKSQLLKSSWLSLSGEPIIKNENIITFGLNATAHYDNNSKTLLFKKLEDLNRIFPGIEVLYREATDPEIDEFLGNDLFDIKNYTEDKMGVRNRKRIALLRENLKSISDKKEFCESLKNYCPDIEIKECEVVVIKTEDNLKNILHALGECFYTTDRSREKRLANSVIKMPK